MLLSGIVIGYSLLPCEFCYLDRDSHVVLQQTFAKIQNPGSSDARTPRAYTCGDMGMSLIKPTTILQFAQILARIIMFPATPIIVPQRPC